MCPGSCCVRPLRSQRSGVRSQSRDAQTQESEERAQQREDRSLQAHTFLSSPSRRVGRVQKFQRARRHREATREISEDKSQKARSPQRGDARKLQRTRVGKRNARRGDAQNNQSPKESLFSFRPDVRRATEAYHFGARRTGRDSKLPSRRGISTRGAESS